MPQKAKKPKKDHIDFEKKLGVAFEDRKQKISDLKRDILAFCAKNKIDDRDAKAALREALTELKERSDIDKV